MKKVITSLLIIFGLVYITSTTGVASALSDYYGGTFVVDFPKESQQPKVEETQEEVSSSGNNYGDDYYGGTFVVDFPDETTSTTDSESSEPLNTEPPVEEPDVTNPPIIEEPVATEPVITQPTEEIKQEKVSDELGASSLDVRVHEGVVLFNVNSKNVEEVEYNFYTISNGEYVQLNGTILNSDKIGHAYIRKNGKYAITYSNSMDRETKGVVEFEIGNSINDTKELNGNTIIIGGLGQSIGMSLQYKGKYAVSVNDYSNDNKYKATYKMFSVEKNGKLKHLYTEVAKDGSSQVLFPEYRKSRIILITSEYKGETKNSYFLLTPDLKHFENYFSGL